MFHTKHKKCYPNILNTDFFKITFHIAYNVAKEKHYKYIETVKKEIKFTGTWIELEKNHLE